MAKLNMTKLEDDVEIDDIVKFSSELIREVMYTSLNDGNVVTNMWIILLLECSTISII